MLQFLETAKSEGTPPKKMPLRRSTRLKSEIFIDDLQRSLLDGEYDILKEDPYSTQMIYEPPKKKTKLSKSAANIEEIEKQCAKNHISDDTCEKEELSHCKRIQVNIKRISRRLINDNKLIHFNSELNLSKQQESESSNNNLQSFEKLKDKYTKSSANVKKKGSQNTSSESSEQLSSDKLVNGNKKNLYNHDGNIANDNFKKSAEISVPTRNRSTNSRNLNDVNTTNPNINGILRYSKMTDNQKNINPKSLLSGESNEESLERSRIIKLPTNRTPENPKNRHRNKTLNQTDDMNNKIKNSQPNETDRPKFQKDCDCQIRLNKTCDKKIFKKMSKLNKKDLKNVSTRHIPKDHLNDTLDMLGNDDHPFWINRNMSCNPSIHLYWEPKLSLVSDQNMKLKYARQFLLRRDWINLSKILFASNLEAKTYFPLLAKYATLLMAHTDKENFIKIIQFLTSITDSNSVMKKCTKI